MLELYQKLVFPTKRLIDDFLGYNNIIFENYVIVKRSSKIFKNSFLKNGKLEFWSKALIISILTYSSNYN